MACKFFQTVYKLREMVRDARTKKSEQRIAHFEVESLQIAVACDRLRLPV